MMLLKARDASYPPDMNPLRRMPQGSLHTSITHWTKAPHPQVLAHTQRVLLALLPPAVAATSLRLTSPTTRPGFLALSIFELVQHLNCRDPA